MKKKTIKLMFAAMAVTALWSGCKKDKDLVPVPQPVVNEPEVFTTMKLKFVDSANVSNIKYATFRDPDADGGAGYDIFDTIKLAPNKTWITTLLLLNEIASPADTVSNEVLEEGVDHLFCFTPTGASAIVNRTDIDANGRQIGLQSKWRTSTLGNGTMQVELRHQPGVKDGSCSPGVTDISINFITKIQ